MFEQQDIDQLNSGIEQWAKKDKQDILSEMDALGIKHSKNSPNKTPLRRAFKDKLSRSSGLINRIGYSLPRSAVYLHKGVGKGRPITSPRGAKPWLNPVIERNLPELGDIVANGQGNMVVNALKIK